MEPRLKTPVAAVPVCTFENSSELWATVNSHVPLMVAMACGGMTY